jgi:hypothetical protein
MAKATLELRRADREAITEFTDDHLKSAVVLAAREGWVQGRGTHPGERRGARHRSVQRQRRLQAKRKRIAALARIQRTGHVDNRVLGGLGFGEKDFLGELSKRTGKGLATLKKQLDAGKVAAADESLETLYSIITKKTGKDLGGAGVAMSTTLRGTPHAREETFPTSSFRS